MTENHYLLVINPSLLFSFSLSFTVPAVNDTLDDIFDESGDEEESQDIVNQVLDEIGIEITGKVRNEREFTSYIHKLVTACC